MRELRLVAVSEDGTSLVLASAPTESSGDESRFRLPIDERLRAAVQLDRLRLGQLEIKVESSLRPREIQARIRAGEPAESVARDAGVPVEHIRRFEGPVLREREHVAEAARRARVRRGDADAGSLGELVDAALRSAAVADDAVRWDSWRLDDGNWMVEVTYRLDGEEPVRARWRFDPLRRAVRPLGPAAAELIGEAADNVRTFAPREPATTSGPASGETAPEGSLDGAPAAAGPPPPAAPPTPPRVPEAPPAVAAAGGRRRASVPSWDEIMFGPKPAE